MPKHALVLEGSSGGQHKLVGAGPGGQHAFYVAPFTGDDFNRSDRNLIGDNGWERGSWPVLSGTGGPDLVSSIAIVTNKVAIGAVGNNSAIVNPSTNNTFAASATRSTDAGDVLDYSIDITHTSGRWGLLMGHTGPGIVGTALARYGQARGVQVLIAGVGANNLLIYDVEEASNVVTFKDNPVSPTSSGTHNYRFQLTKSTGVLKFWQDGVLYLTTAAGRYPSHTGTYIAFGSGDAAGVSFDNIVVL